MPVSLVTVSLPSLTGINADRMVNTFNFAIEAAGTPDGTAAITAAEIVPLLEDFYDVPATIATTSISEYLSGMVARNEDVTVKIYHRPAAGPLGPPDEIGTFQIATAALSADDLPSEVAACLSINAAAPGTVPSARRRGRIYIGPLSQAALSEATGVPRLIANFVSTLAEKAVSFKSDVAALRAAPNRTLWSVFSTMDNVGRAVQVGFVDNAFDTQRRRGEVASSRTNWGP